MPAFTDGLAIFANWQTVVLCLGIYGITSTIRSVVENAPSTKAFSKGWIWRTVLLPAGPIATGVIIAALSKKFPWPDQIAHAGIGLLMYGGICGMGSGWGYARFRDWFGLAADKGSPVATKVAATMLNRPLSGRPPPMALGPPRPRNYDEEN